MSPEPESVKVVSEQGVFQVVLREQFAERFVEWAESMGQRVHVIPVGDADLPTYGIGPRT